MTKPSPEGGTSIEKLLEDRAQFVSWLTRLNSSSGAPSPVPEAVRGRVRADYERRLEAVLAELRSHTSALEDQVSGLQARAGELASREGEHKEHLSEAEIRHMVGEYDDSKWDGIRTELLKVLAHVHDELSQTHAEIDRLNEVLGTIRSPVAAAPAEPEPEPIPEPPAPPPPAPTIASGPRPAVTTSGSRAALPPEPMAPPPAPAPPPPVVEPIRPAATAPAPASAEIPFRPAPPRPQPKPPAPPAAPVKKDDQPSRTLWFPSGKPAETGGGGGKLDELAFLKSVTGNEAPAAPPTPAPLPARGRASGGFTRAPEPVAPEPPPEPKAPAVDAAKDRSSGNGQKTLKCGECGTLNRPTEWYCERCGAELAAL
ncbi:MAG: hypothetical protein IPJ95_12395 [Gemmatimonadetes bacterium]|nr:hypothetical protein [Gemmatimonadota bacterium]